MAAQMTSDPASALNGKSVLDELRHAERVQAADVWSVIRFLRPYSSAYVPQFLAMAALLVAEMVINACFPLATKLLIDRGLTAPVKNAGVVVGVLIFLAVANLTIAALGVLLDYLNARTFSSMIMEIRQQLFTRLQGLSMRFFTRTHGGEISSRFSGDVVALEGTLTSLVMWGIEPLLEIVYSLCLLFYFNVWLAAIALLTFPLTLLLPRFFAARAYALSYDKRLREGEVLSAVEENVTAQTVVKAFGLAHAARTRFRALNLLWLAVTFRVHFLGAMVERSATSGSYLVHFLTFGLGAWWVYSDRITLGTLVAFEGTLLSMGYAITGLTQYVPTLAQSAGSIRHIDDLLERSPEVEDAPNAAELPRLGREIAFDDVSFHYEQGAFELQHVDLVIPRGSFTAFVGPSGAGKSTMLSLLLRFYDPTAGAIFFDGHDLRSVSQDSLRAQIGTVFQDAILFNTTLLENIRIGKPSATKDEVEAAARAAEIHEFVVSLPDGYQTIVGERGSELSGGQRQRLAIARALVRDPAILILDEPTSAVDSATEAALNDTLLRIARNRTVFLVTHHLSTALSAAHIVVLGHGRVLEQGSERELLARDGAYRAMWREQRSTEIASELADASPAGMN